MCIKSKHIFLWVLVIVFLIGVASFLITPFQYDLFLYIGSAKQADFISGNWMYKALNSWEVKGFLARFLIYSFYKISLIFFKFGSKPFEICFKTLYALLIFGVSYLSVSLCFKKDYKIEKFMTILGLSSFFYLAQSWNHIQPETTGVLLLVLALAIAINACQNSQKKLLKFFLTGILLGLLAGLKSILILLVGSFFMSLYLICKQMNLRVNKKEILIILGGIVTSSIILLTLILTMHPQELTDMADVSILQGTLLTPTYLNDSSLTPLNIYHQFFINLVESFYRISAVFIGFIAFIGLLMEYRKRKHFMQSFALILMWLIPCISIILSNRYFGYHYFPFVYCAIVSSYLFIDTIKDRTIKPGFIIAGIVICLFSLILQLFPSVLYSRYVGIVLTTAYTIIAILMLMSVIFEKYKLEVFSLSFIIGIIFYLNYISLFSVNMKNWFAIDKEVRNENSKLYIGEDPVLYLDVGMAAYVFKNKSYIRYHFGLPLQRLPENSRYIDRCCYKDTLAQALAYNGKYIVYWNKFMVYYNPQKLIKDKLQREYVLDNQKLKFARMTKLMNILKPHGSEAIADIDIYKRKTEFDTGYQK